MKYVDESRSDVRGPPDDIYNRCATTNSYPSNAEALIREKEAARDHLARLEATLAMLEAERSRLQGILAKYDVILHPIRHIPSEIMQKIFSSCIERSNIMISAERFPRTSLNPSQVPWVLGHVCRTWRALALSTPNIWSSVSLVIRRRLEDSNEKHVSSHLLRLGLQLDRSEDHPLDVSLYLDREQSFHPWTVLLCSRSQQWRYLRLEGDSRGFRPISRIQHFLPALENLELSIASYYSQADIDWLEQAPRLKSLSLTTIPSTKLPFAQIKNFRWREDFNSSSSFSYSSFVSSKLWPMLRSLSGVEACSLEFVKESQPYASSDLANLHYKRLRKLELMSSSSRQVDVQCLLAKFTAPRLTHLFISSKLTEVNVLVDFVGRSACKLTNLVIYSAESVTSNNFARILSVLPELTHLEFGFPTTDDHLFVLSTTPVVVPRLETLCIYSYPGCKSSYSDDVWLNTLEFRASEQLISLRVKGLMLS
uniref:Uncharacterized protein n=1 Tax=Moniliophthora roreri TaxID=221103 RepID=A0A0W0ET98_MONRR